MRAGHRVHPKGAARAGRDRGLPQVGPGLPTAVSDDPEQARAVASWWVAFYLTSMGQLYAATLRRAGLGAAVDDVLAACAANRNQGIRSIGSPSPWPRSPIRRCGGGC